MISQSIPFFCSAIQNKGNDNQGSGEKQPFGGFDLSLSASRKVR